MYLFTRFVHFFRNNEPAIREFFTQFALISSILGLLFFSFVSINFAAVETNNWIFNTPANYTYDTAKIEVIGGEAILKSPGAQINDNTQAEFDLGTYNNTRFQTDHVELDINRVVPTANTLVLYYLDETSGTVTDSSGNGNNGTNNGATQGVAGKIDKAISLDGLDDYINIPADLGDPDAMTIEFWFKKPNINAGADYLLDGRNNGNWWFLQDYATGANCTDTNGNICFNGLVEIPSTMLSNDTWYHVALTANTTETKIYLDGNLVDTGSAFNPNLGADVHIGTRFTNTAYFQGTIDELSIWNTALDSGTVAQHAQAGYLSSGNFTSAIFDAGQNAAWSQISWTEDLKTLTDWLSINWSNRKKITIDNTGNASTLADYQVKLDITYDAKMNSDFSDLRFTSSDGTTELDFWVQDYAASTNATVWVEVPSIPASSIAEIYVYYGNSEATSISDGEDTFLLFDDFDDNSINTSKWLEIDIPADEITESGDKLGFTRTSNGNWNKAIIAQDTLSRDDLSFEADYEWTVNNPDYDAIMFGWHDSGTAASYPNLVYAYYNPGSGGSSTVGVSVYEDGTSRSGETGSWTVNTDYDIRVRMRASGGAYYEQSTDGGDTWTTNYTSSYSTESDLKPAWSFYSGTHRYDNVRVRKWTSPEPTSTYGSEEDQIPTDLRFRVRSCDDDSCSGESFVGPDGTVATYFTNPAGESLNVAGNRYFQYISYLTNSNVEFSPDVSSVTIDYLTYPTDNPTIQPVSSLNPPIVNEWSSFIESSTKPAGTEIYYQLSDNDGTTWQYWDGANWAMAGGADYNTANTINTNIFSFSYSSGRILFKAFLEGSGDQTPRLNNIRIDYQGDVNTVNCTNDWTFNNSANYTYNSSLIAVSGSKAELITVGSNFVDNEQAEFDSGTYSQTTYDTDHIELAASQTSGTYTSSIKNAGSNVDWQTFSWTSLRPYGKELPGDQQTESAYTQGNANMGNNLLLMHMNETSGSITDSSGNGNDGTNNGATSAIGKFDNSLYFGGDGDAVESNSYTYTFADELTLSAWFKYDGAGTGSPRILEISANGDANSHALAPDGDGSLRAWAECNNGTRVASVDDSTNYNDGNWHHMVYTYDSPNGILYVDGVQTGTNSGACADLDDGSELILGAISDISGAYAHSAHAFEGWVDEAAVWDRALSPTEVEDHYLRGATNLKYQVRSCDDAACSGETYIGPDGTTATYYSEISNTGLGLPQLTLTNLPQNQYFQYQANFSTDDVTYSPELYDVSIVTNGSNYSSDAPTIQPTTSFTQTFLNSLTGFEETSTKEANSEIYYQLSNDDAATWLWWDGSSWADIENGLASDANTIALWHLNNLTDAVIDSSGNSNNGLNNGSTRGVAGHADNAFDFDGIDDYIDIPYVASLGLVGTDFTIDFWINTTDTDGLIFKKYTGSIGGDAWGIRLASGIIEFYDGTSWISSGIQADTGTWTHIAITGDNFANNLEFFENGISTGTASFNNITANAQDLFIGSDLSTSYFDGSLDEIRISDTIRSDTDIFISTRLFNTAANVAANINAFTITGTNIMFKAFLKSDGTDQATLDNLRLSCTYSTNTSPIATVPTNITQSIDGSGHITFETTVSDTNNDDTKVKIEYSDDGGINWYDAEINSISVSSGTADINNASAYQIGDTNLVDTSGGSVDLTITWDTKSTSNGNGSMDDMDLTNVQIRVIPNDLTTDGTEGVSASFEVDNLDPAGLSNFAISGQTTSSLSFTFTSVSTENNFDHYEIWYDINQTDVENRVSAHEWDNNDDAGLATMTTNSTTITGLNDGTTLYAKIWAIDDFGNEMTTGTISGTTSSSGSGGGSGGGGGGGGGSGGSSSIQTKSNVVQPEQENCLVYDELRDRTFVDLPTDHWAYEYLEFLKKTKLIEGDQYILSGYGIDENTTEAEVGPDNNVMRYELIKMALSANCIQISEDISSGAMEFSDISRTLEEASDENIEATNYVKRIMYTALDRGIISGYEEDFSARPWDSVNRAEAVKIILNAGSLDIFDTNLSESEFLDVSVDDWFYNYILFAFNKGLVSGYASDPGYFHPEDTMTRAQVAKVITLTMSLVGSIDVDIAN